MNLFRGIGQRINMVIAAVVVGIGIFICGIIMAFVVSPTQALEWRRIQGLPELSAAEFTALATGEELAITGTLAGNEALTPDGLVLYERDRWEVGPPDENDNTADGYWTNVEGVYPALKMEMGGSTVDILPATSLILNLVPYETIVDADSGITAADGDRTLHEGALRTRGFKDGELITIVGTKASVGGVAPQRISGGDRVQLVEDIRAGARAAFTVGIIMMICAPIAIISGVVGAIFGRRRGGAIG